MAAVEQKLIEPDLKQEFGVRPDMKQKKVWKCELCDKPYLLIGSLQKHKKLEHPDGTLNENHTCEICGKSFNKKSKSESSFEYFSRQKKHFEL